MEQKIIISVSHLSKSFRLPHEKHTGLKQALINFKPGQKYETQPVLKDLSFEIKRGEFFGIVGKNGSGKSTLLKLLAKIYTPDSGEIVVNGSLTPFIELGVGFNPELTGRENIFLNGALLGFDRREVEAMYDDIVSFAELERFMDQRLKNYSSGMQVRLAFSIAIRAKTDILLIDEVLAVGDAAFQQKCMNYFEELKNTDTTVILVTHDMTAVRRFCTNAMFIDDGKIIQYGSVSAVASAYTADNIRRSQRATVKADAPRSGYAIESTITATGEHTQQLQISVSAATEEPTFIGVSILKDGISIAEIVTSPKHPIKGDTKTTFAIDTSLFNGGMYEVATALFQLRNRELIAAIEANQTFFVEGNDPTRGAAIKLKDTWDYAAIDKKTDN